MASDLVYTIINDGNRAQKKGYEWGVKAWKKWAALNDKHIFVYNHIDTKIDPRWMKYEVFNILKSRGLDYERILYVDSDTIPSPKTPDIFELSDKFAAVENFGSLDHVIRSIENYGELFPKSKLQYTEYFNTGLMLFNKSHKEMLERFNKWRKENWNNILLTIEKYKSGQDQTFFNHFTNCENVDIIFLPFKYNIQDLIRRECFRGIENNPYYYLDLIPDGVWHFNCFESPKKIIQELYEKLWN